MTEIMNLQLFADGGGDGGSATAGTAAASDGTTVEAVAEKGKVATSQGRKGNPLENVIYGRQTSQDSANPKTGVQASTPEADKTKAFENLIKGEYREEFQKRTQGIINERFKETKSLQDKLSSQTNLMRMLADKYGVNADDLKGLTSAIENDDSFYQREAMEKGLTVKQLKEVKALERENEEFRKAQQEQETRQHVEQINAEWLKQADELKSKYGLDNFDFNAEATSNPEFTKLLGAGVSVESAYMATHFDDMMGGAMARTAEVVRTKMADSIGQRASRPTENGISASKNATFKTDVRSLTKADRDEIERRVRRGETIRF